MPKWLGENKPVILPGGRALLSRLRCAGPVYNAARQRLDLVYEVLEAEPSALPLAGGSVNALVGNYQARGALPCVPRRACAGLALCTPQGQRCLARWDSAVCSQPSSNGSLALFTLHCWWMYADTGIRVH